MSFFKKSITFILKPYQTFGIKVFKKVNVYFACLFVLISIYPSDLQYYRNLDLNNNFVGFVEGYGRHVNTLASIVLPIIARDVAGFVQGGYLMIGIGLATVVLKKLYIHITINGVNLGERPNEGMHNMPSGHSSVASAAMFFVIKRYGMIHAVYLLPITFATMYARIALMQHTLSAVLCGLILGFIIANVLTTTREKITIKPV